jgi:hypothetical protein
MLRMGFERLLASIAQMPMVKHLRVDIFREGCRFNSTPGFHFSLKEGASDLERIVKCRRKTIAMILN